MRPELEAILFDLDGTLLDSFESHLEIYRVTLARFGVAIDAGEFRRHYTPNWNEFYRRVGLPPGLWEAANAEWLREAAGHRPMPFPGVGGMLASLARRFRLGIVTGGSRPRVRDDLERGGISERFEVVVTVDDVREPKPAPEGLLLALRLLGLPPGHVLYVGDTGPDYDFARAAGVAFVCVASGFSAPDPRAGYPCLASVTDLPGFLGAG